MSKNIGSNIGKSLSSKYSLLDYAADVLKIVSKRAIQKKSRSNWYFNWKWNLEQEILLK